GAILKKNARKKMSILEGFHHRTALRNYVGEVTHPFCAVGKMQAQAIFAQLFHSYDFHKFYHSSSSGPGTRSNGTRCRPRCQFSMSAPRRSSIHSRTSLKALGGSLPPMTSPVSIAIRASYPW